MLRMRAVVVLVVVPVVVVVVPVAVVPVVVVPVVVVPMVVVVVVVLGGGRWVVLAALVGDAGRALEGHLMFGHDGLHRRLAGARRERARKRTSKHAKPPMKPARCAVDEPERFLVFSTVILANSSLFLQRSVSATG